jgi:hypothetical protein
VAQPVRICDAASWRAFSLSAAKAASSLADLVVTVVAPGSLCAGDRVGRLAQPLRRVVAEVAEAEGGVGEVAGPGAEHVGSLAMPIPRTGGGP